MSLTPERRAEIERQQREINECAIKLTAAEMREGLIPSPYVRGSVAPPATRATAHATDWLAPVPLRDGLPAVAAFELELLPDILRARVTDVAERMQCPPDLVAVPLVIALASIIGRRCGIAPKRHDDWYVVPNLWGLTVAPPGFQKTPAAREAIGPLESMQARAVADFESAKASHEAQVLLDDAAGKVAKDAIRKALRIGKTAEAGEHAERAVTSARLAPCCRRYIVNDATTEKIGELLRENPHGLLVVRDEIAGLFASLERQGHEADRAFLLEAWNGTGAYCYDRIGRGSVHIPALCLSILGTIQPAPLCMLVRRCTSLENDGLLQRFQLAVWPDVSDEFTLIDRAPDFEAKRTVADAFERLDTVTAEGLGAEAGPVPLLRFDADAQRMFDAWLTDLEQRLRSGNESAVLVGHLAKYRSLVPSLALVFHLAESSGGPVTLSALERAVAWSMYLETHARRIYAPALAPDMESARALAARIKAGGIASGFALRDVYRNCWSQLATVADAEAAVRVLTDFDWLRSWQKPTEGRTRTVYEINPVLLRNTP